MLFFLPAAPSETLPAPPDRWAVLLCSGFRCASQRRSEVWLSPKVVPARRPATLISSSRSGQCIPSPPPIRRQWLRSAGVPWSKRGYQATGVCQVRGFLGDGVGHGGGTAGSHVEMLLSHHPIATGAVRDLHHQGPTERHRGVVVERAGPADELVGRGSRLRFEPVHDRAASTRPSIGLYGCGIGLPGTIMNRPQPGRGREVHSAPRTYSLTFFPNTSSGTFPPATTVSLNARRSNLAPSARRANSRWRLISLCPTL